MSETRFRWGSIALALPVVLVLIAAAPAREALGAGPAKTKGQRMTSTEVKFEKARFSDLPGWDKDDHLAALETFLKSCTRVLASVEGAAHKGRKPPPPTLLVACEDATRLASSGRPTAATAKAFFETHFAPHRVVHGGAGGLLTAYYEPLIKGSRTQTKRYAAPVYRRPKDLVNLVDESERGAKSGQLTHARLAAGGMIPYPTRAEIEQGALAGLGLELVYLESPVDVFFMQVQGSGRIALPDGTTMRITYDGKNGHPYSSVGRHLIATGQMAESQVSLQALEAFLKADPERGRQAMWQNASYVFFRELVGAASEAPMGVLEIPLTAGRSLAVDTTYHSIGLPIYVSAPELRHVAGDRQGFHRLMIAQDVGSAIKGPERGDIYVGSGDAAGRIAGVTKHAGNFFVLLPADWPTLQEAKRDSEPRLVRQASQ